MAKTITNKDSYIDNKFLVNFLDLVSKNLLYFNDGELYIGIGEICDAFEIKKTEHWEIQNQKLGQIFEKINLKDLGVQAVEEVSGLTPDVETSSPISNLKNCDPTLNGIIFEVDIEEFKKSLEHYSHNKNIGTKEKMSLIEKEINFDDNRTTIKISGKDVFLPPFKNEHFLCRVMFQHLKGEPIDWSIVYEEMTDDKEPDSDKKTKNKRMVYDTMEALNTRIKEILNTDDDFFTFKERTITRNY
ncbi:MAG: hypothetical protein A3A98_02220 [Candidatus Staskawiczbacteria bacterium RIFCSPLOWO2_01_FULL_40_39]|uniref:Uncharacterized protein n=1 Tax=Candidatus Staskawiczbacteria bacterium RIFCSPHIGHO2_01_FULL_39_25 TaxID=1802202 RepID=A0A1G2HQP8_9BACT|nr:MAG: hypothetical protein A2730_03830 [Candidatus Staskawiczbacteria bacterium RIFCSPHIGHO2_01_FULL_39_25]OGZ74065.1 MAG: hypothetical protein A3A98_02220 [Candidatus Staskawiczbacteria bacterium RIFCSPLOWO2_01_FULL_40_39]OGZ76253.1 MAG: hypothetical protein A3I87_02285 [Candidatus Staskawiczbacteria bacterium RIFCSPLOWO2_02_FULL_39_8]